MHPSEEKQSVRDSIKERIARLPAGKRESEERSLCRRIRKEIGNEPKVITGYMPRHDEANILPLLEELLSEGWQIFLPAFEGKSFVFRQLLDFAELKPGALSIPEPPHTAPLLDPHKLDIALIPARAYTAKGDRLGRGNGGYDFWIRKQRELNPQTKMIGVALECQILQSIPMEAHDEHVDMVITARGVEGATK